MPLEKRLFNLRQKSGQSLQEVADAVGFSKAHAWELEKGHSRNPSFDLVQRLARHYGVSIDTLVGEDEEPTTEALQIERIHRGLEMLTDRDREVVEQTIKAMQAQSEGQG